ncbi:hypothetical protein BKA69DRAFT_1127690 [Paraphysoderma sedebokerense]|nr:hypothetical protein BKA69DRAFT_1127690 [Paraphysoderma sedebokerense]
MTVAPQLPQLLSSTYASSVIMDTLRSIFAALPNPITSSPQEMYNSVLLPWFSHPLTHLKSHFDQSHPLYLSLQLLVLVILWTWLSAAYTGNCSQVDRLWSIVPFLYAFVFLLKTFPVFDARITVATFLTFLWGARLTYNFYRKGGYQSGHEDYRWPALRKIIKEPYGVLGNVYWQIFNFTFISVFQSVLLWLIVGPIMMVCWSVRQRSRSDLLSDGGVIVPWNVIDTLATVLFIASLTFETIADEQQWKFQTKKYAMLKEAQRQVNAVGPGVSIQKPSGLLKGSLFPHITKKVDTNLGSKYQILKQPTSAAPNSPGKSGSRSDQPGSPGKVRRQSQTSDGLNFGTKETEVTAKESLSPQINGHVHYTDPNYYLDYIPHPYNLGFITTGLFKYSRHPNFFCEIANWFIFYLFSISASTVHTTLSRHQLPFSFPISYSFTFSSDWTTLHVLNRSSTMYSLSIINWTLTGAVILMLLFQGSTIYTEYLTGKKYKYWKDYCLRTSRLIPMWSGGELRVANDMSLSPQ